MRTETLSHVKKTDAGDEHGIPMKPLLAIPRVAAVIYLGRVH
jgi:hypothetical protein